MPPFHVQEQPSQGKGTVEVHSSTVRALVDEVQALRREVRALSRASQSRRQGRKEDSQKELPRLQALADEVGISRSAMYRKLDRHGIPVRGSMGFPKEEGDRSAAHVSRTEWEAKGKKDTRTVRQNAGFYDEDKDV